MGRPTSYNAEVAEAICLRLMECETLRQICEDDAMPSRSMVFRWLQDHAEFRDQYARAREVQADIRAEELVEIADRGGEGDTQRARLMVDTRKWLMSKAAPKKYGDKIDHTLASPDGGPVQFQRIERVVIRPSDRDT